MNPMYPMNNPVMALISAAKNGGNPVQMMRQMAGNTPQMRQFMQMVNGKSPQQLRQMAENVAKERGTSLQAVAQQLGIPFN